MKYSTQGKEMEDNISTMVEKTINKNFEELEVSFQQGSEEGEKCGGVSNTNPTRMTMTDLFERVVTNTRVKEKTEKCRRLLELGATDPAKKCKLFEQDSFLASILVEGGADKEHCVKFNNTVLDDYDGVSPEEVERCRELLRSDEHVLLFYKTISGNGFHILVRVEGVTDEKSHKIAWQQVSEYYDRKLGLKHDKSCSDLARKSILAHDPDAFFNPNAIPINIDYYQLVAGKKPGRPLKDVHHKLEEVGKYVKEYMKNCCKVEYVEGSRNDYIFKASCQLNRYGVDKEEALDFFREKAEDLSPHEIEQTVNSAYNRFPEQHGTLSPFNHKERKQEKAKGKSFDLQEVEDYMRTLGEYRQNTITQRYEIRWTNTTEWVPVTDCIINDIWRDVNKNVRQVQVQVIKNIIESSFSRPYNPYIESFEALPAWDGETDYIGQIAQMVHVRPGNEDYYPFAKAFPKWVVAFVASIFDPKAFNKKIMTLVGPQNTYKTTYFRSLALPEWGELAVHVKNSFKDFDKDEHISMTQSPIFCLDEISHLGYNFMDELKSLTSQTTISKRRAYAHYEESRPRIASFCATGNYVNFLNDPTGNNRFLVYEVTGIDSPYTTPMNLVGMWSQAYHLYRSGFRYWFDAEEDALIDKQNVQYEVSSAEEDLINTYYRIPEHGDSYILVNATNIIEHIGAGYKGTLTQQKVNQVMRKLGYEYKKNNGRRGFRVVELEPSEVQNRRQSSDWSHLPPPEDKAVKSVEPEIPFWQTEYNLSGIVK